MVTFCVACTFTVCYFQFKNNAFCDLISFFDFVTSDVALVTSLRDGMNLVSYEFVACQEAKKGVLILSEVITCTFQLNKVLI